MAEEAMESYLYAAFPPYSYRYPPPKGKGGWRPRGGGFAGYREAAAAEYFDNYQRAQLKAILSQVNPNLTPRLRKANTKEVGVQVNPRQDASVQCSLGPRTLLRRRPAPPRPPEQEQEQGSPAAARAVRFPRTVAVYSPVASRRLTALLPEEQPREDSCEKPPEGGAEPPEQRPPAAPQPRRDAEEKEPPAEPPAAPQPQEAGKTRLRFQFLEQKYGYYHCKDCNIRWESAYVWSISASSAAPARSPTTRIAWRTSPARGAGRPAAPAP
ncbi:zygote arrest protein 1 isoform X2 [Cuculus canorus]|uniref:zygote arrest protein 1 isoform X2 n=1 Tax=Cuculus canorus TaxID=55661 RepID=UPI0023AB4F5C|nr:zygote arrest protein 1 isoform X2 [Cuculus canorus]